MKQKVIPEFSLFLFFVFAGLCRADLTGEVVKATIYPQGALVTEKVVFDLESTGESEVVVSDLPARLKPDSVFIKCQKGLDITNFEVKDVIRKTEDLLEPCQKQLKELENRQKAITLRLETIKQKRDFLLKLKDDPKRDFRALYSFVTENLSRLSTDESEAEAELEDIKEKIKELKDKIEWLGKQKKDFKARELVISLTAAAPGRHTLFVSYLTNFASWEPLYRLEFNEREKAINIDWQGRVLQKTGKDWKNVSISLSTARALRYMDIPHLYPWYLDIYQRRTPGVKSLRPETELLETFKAGSPPPEAIKVKEHLTAVTYELPGKVTVTGEGKATTLKIKAFSFPATINYIAIPELASCGYIQAEAENKSNFTFMSAPCRLVAGNRYLGKITLPEIAPGEKFKLSLGEDRKIRLKKELIKKYRENKGGVITKKKEKIKFKYRLTIENQHDFPVEVTVKDRIPVSRHEDIKVKNVESSLEPQKQDEKGMLKWKIKVKPHEKFSIVYEFAVEYPAGAVVSGL